MPDDKDQQLAALLREYESGFLPYPVFEQIARLIALPILEFIPLRKGATDIEVLLIARSADDPFWPGLLHTPGTVIRADDINEDHTANWPAFERIVKDELQGTKTGSPHYAGSQLHKSKRGVEQAQIYWVEVVGQPAVGTFYPVNDLPAALVDSQQSFIGLAVSSYRIWLDQQL